MIVAFIFVSIVGIGSFLFCTKKGIQQQRQEEKDALLDTIAEINKEAKKDFKNKSYIKF